jgi:hypothetical protein
MTPSTRRCEERSGRMGHLHVSHVHSPRGPYRCACSLVASVIIREQTRQTNNMAIHQRTRTCRLASSLTRGMAIEEAEDRQLAYDSDMEMNRIFRTCT